MHSLEIALIRTRRHPVVYYKCTDIEESLRTLKTICIDAGVSWAQLPDGNLQVFGDATVKLVDLDEPLPTSTNPKSIIQEYRTPTRNDETRWRTLKLNMTL